jgi:hypothetical protein
MLRWTGLGKNSSSSSSGGNNASTSQSASQGNGGDLQVGSDGLTEDERLALEEMDRFYGMENVSPRDSLVSRSDGLRVVLVHAQLEERSSM